MVELAYPISAANAAWLLFYFWGGGFVLFTKAGTSNLKCVAVTILEVYCVTCWSFHSSVDSVRTIISDS